MPEGADTVLMASAIERRVWPVNLRRVAQTPRIALKKWGGVSIERIARETGIAEANLAQKYGITAAGIETAKLLAIPAAAVPADFPLRDGPRETEFVQAVVGRYGEEGIYDSLRRILAQLEPTKITPEGIEVYSNVGVITEGKENERIPISLYLDPKSNQIVIGKGEQGYLWLTINETAELSEQLTAQIMQLASDLREGIADPDSYRQIVGSEISGYFADRAIIRFPRKYYFRSDVLADRQRRFAAVERYAAVTPGIPADRLTIAQFIGLVLRLCGLFIIEELDPFNKQYYRELLAASDSENGIWQKRIEAINVNRPDFVSNFLGSQVRYLLGRPGGPDPLTARVNLAQVTNMSHGYAPIRNRFWVVPNEENTPMKGGYSLHGGRFFLMLHPAEESTHSQPWLDAYEVLMQAGVPVRISEQVKEWIRAEDLVERSAAEARRLNVPAAEIKCDTSIECGFRLRELRFL